MRKGYRIKNKKTHRRRKARKGKGMKKNEGKEKKRLGKGR